MTFINIFAYLVALAILFAIYLIIYSAIFYFRVIKGYEKHYSNTEKYKDHKISRKLRIVSIENKTFADGDHMVYAYIKGQEDLLYALKMPVPENRDRKERLRVYDVIKIWGHLEGRLIYTAQSVNQSHAPFVIVERFKKKA